MTNLSELRLWANNITDISPLSNLTQLSWLDLSFNNVSDISSLGGLTNLTELLLRGNPLSSSSINDHIPSFKRSGVTVYFDSFRVGSNFDIELVFLDDDFTQVEKRIIQYAARRWMSIIRDDLPDYTFTQGWSRVCDDHSAIPSGERIDDLRIYVTSFYAFSPLGFASTSLLRDTSLLPVSGCMSLNLQPRRSYYSTPVWRYYYYDSSADLLYTALHEIGHVLGIGIVWEDLGFVQDPNGDAHFNGPLAIAAFNDAGGQDYTGAKVPLEKDLSHWRLLPIHHVNPLLSEELMALVGGKALSAITIQSLADLGYSVDVTQADPYTLPDIAAKASAKIAAPSTHAQPEWSCGAGQAQEPIYVVDSQGRIVRTISP